MKYFNSFLTNIFLISLMIVLISCSTGKTPIEPENPGSNISEIPDYSIGQSDSRTVVAEYKATIDVDSQTFSIAPDKRSTTFHFELTQLYPNILTITGYGFTPNFWADIKLSHPLPSSGIDVFDPRVIAILPANDGVSANFPNENLLTNNSVLIEPDGYTKLWDNSSIPGSANPFIAYFKDQSYRQWSSIYPQNETKRWQMDIDGFGGPPEFELVVDISTNYPDIPYPYTDNAPEPVQIELTIGDGMTNEGGSADIDAIITDWQGQGTIGGVSIEAPDLFDGTVNLDFVEQVDTFDFKYTGTISNELLAAAGEYPVLISSWDINTVIHAYQLSTARVDHVSGFDIEDVKPTYASHSHGDITINGDYAFVTGGKHYGNISNELLIYDISDITNARFITSVKTQNHLAAIEADGEYLYLSSETSPSETLFEVVDISNPNAPSVVHTLEFHQYISKLKVIDDFLCAMHRYGLMLIDISHPPSAHLIFQILPAIQDFEVADGYLYLYGNSSLNIYKFDPPYPCEWINSVEDSGQDGGFCINEGYAYIVDTEDDCLNIIDIDPPESASIVSIYDDFPVNVHNPPIILETYEDYLFYIAQYDPHQIEIGLHILDISNRENPEYTQTLTNYISETNIAATDSLIHDEKLVFTSNWGINVVDFSTPFSAVYVGEITNLGWVDEAYPIGNYLYVASDLGLQILDISSPESASIVTTVLTPRARGVRVKDGYAYVADLDLGLVVIDVQPFEDAHIVETFHSYEYANDIAIDGDYIYLGGLAIFDIHDPENVQLVFEVPATYTVTDVAAANGYAYVTSGIGGLNIFDVDPPELAHNIAFIAFENASGVDVSGDHIIVGYRYGEICTVDISEPSSPRVVDTINAGVMKDVSVSGVFGYFSEWLNGQIRIVDISNPADLEFIVNYNVGTTVTNVNVQDNYAYASADHKLKIVKLW